MLTHSGSVQPVLAVIPDVSTTTTQSSHQSGPPLKTHRIRLVPHLESSRSLAFDPVVREMIVISVPPGGNPAQIASAASAGKPAIGKTAAAILKVGRFTDKTLPVPGASNNVDAGILTGSSGPYGAAAMILAGGGGELGSGKVTFRSKVVSRGHAEIWCEAGGKVGANSFLYELSRFPLVFGNSTYDAATDLRTVLHQGYR
jgi:hypothetical protein